MNKDFSTSVPFDPGFAPYVAHFSSNYETIKKMLMSFKAMQQRKFKFKMIQPQIKKLFENSVSFYTGCLLWAYYIKNEHPDKKISGNVFFQKKSDDYDYLFEIEYLIKSFKDYERDVKYYLNQNSVFPETWLDTVESYKQFLELNKNFYNAEFASQICIPEHFTNNITLSNEEILNKIEQAIDSQNLGLLL